ncbi:MAG: DUF2971 domain-containing protein [Sedimentisphaerales bacterium]|nr:DUF2971 domain-containing protein [Sedimentisphaerales bacterium]
MTSEHYIRLRSIPNRPETYFKYLTAEVAKIILVNHTLRWSSPLLFDDIFDVKRDFDFGFDIEELKEPIVNEIKNLLSVENIPDLSSRPLVDWFIQTLRRQDCDNKHKIILKLPQLIDKGIHHAKNNSYEMIKKQWSEFIPQFRILCLSAVNDNLCMWAHYSDSHKGVVLEFQSINYLDSPWLIAQPIVYQDSPPILATKQEWIKSITGQKLLKYDEPQFWEPYIITKKIDWEYQKEWRVVDFCDKGETGLFSDYGFDPRELRSVYLGCDISEKDVKDITSLLKFDLAHVKVFSGKRLDGERELSFEKIKP